MTIVQSIDAERDGVREEIEQLEAQLGSKRERLDALERLREQAAELDSGQKAPPAPKRPSASSKASRRQQGAPTGAKNDEKVLAVIAGFPEGIAPSTIVEETALSKNQVKEACKRLRDSGKIRGEGGPRNRRYFPKGAPGRPKPAPAREERAEPAPAKQKSRSSKVTAPPPDSPAKAAHNALRNRLKTAIVELVADSEPITGEEIATMVLEQIPEAEREDIRSVLIILCGAHGKERQLERSGDGSYRLAGRSSNGRTVTQLEADVVSALGSGRTAREVAANVEQLRGNAVSAKQVLEALVRRNVIRKREGSDPAVFEALEVPA